MKNRDQVRAANALAALAGKGSLRGVKGGDVLSGFPALVMGNGLLATIAFCKSKKDSDHEAVCDAIARHLCHRDIDLLEKDCDTTQKMLETLVALKSDRLRLCTAEALAYLNYLRRFAKAAELEPRKEGK